ncbi:hypothetical protein JHK87_052066 [Glycine soja]|nr:hypothetical protein JHK87_052066 [Glycine soja]
MSRSFEINSGPAHNRRYICVLQIETGDGIVQMSGDEKSKVNADNSAASLMLLALQQQTGDGILQMSGDEKSKIKDADNSTASFMLLALLECKKLIICEKDLKRKTSSIQKGNEVEHYLQYAFLW